MEKDVLDKIKYLREITGVGVQDCLKALKECKFDAEKSKLIIQKKSVEIAQSKLKRPTNTGIVSSYLHAGSKVGVLLEICCETDFVARNEEFIKFASNISKQIAYSSSSTILDYNSAVTEEGVLNQFFTELCVFDSNTTVSDYIFQQIARFGENIKIKRFIKFISE